LVENLERWMPKLVQKSPNVRDDCYFTILKYYQRHFLNGYFEIVTAPHLSPLAIPTQLLHAAFSRTGQWSPEWNARRFDQAFLKYLVESPKAQHRIKELRVIARSKIVFLVGYNPNPSVCGRKLLKNLIQEGLNR